MRARRHNALPNFRLSTITENVPGTVREDFRIMFGELGRLQREKGVPVTVVMLPDRRQVLNDGSNYALQKTMKSLAAEAGIDIYDPVELLRAQPDRRALYIPDWHYTARGYGLVVDGLNAHLKNKSPAFERRSFAMSFVDKEFFYFLLVFALVWHFTRGRYELKIAAMLAMSLLFYGFHRWWLVLLIGAYCVADWAAALAIERSRRPKLALVAGLTFNLGVLAAWKYTPLLIVTINSLTGWKLPGTEAIDGWFIPMGISFYGFSGIAYMVDVYRGVVKAEPSLIRFSLFTTFFPHLVAGPILRAKEFLSHLRPGELPERPEAPLEGTFLIARGFFKKLVLADLIAIAIDPFFADVSGTATAGVWSLPYVYLYALQIYFDFSGYTDIARGLGLWFGFRWPENFNWPYFATSIQDFWRRWHMTLSRFLRDYLYIPLGGSRHGVSRALSALMLTMLLGGLWHGASWSFMIWGGLHGLFLCINYLWAKTSLHRALAGQKASAQRSGPAFRSC